MKTESEVRGRIQDLLQMEVERRLAEAVERLPHRCAHNYRHPLDARKRAQGDPNPRYNRITGDQGLPVIQTIGLCMLGSEDPSQWAGSICDEPLDAKRCPYFVPARTRESIAQELDEQMKNPNWVKENFPEIHALLWVLEEVTLPKLRWWRRLLLRFHRPRLEPTLPAVDPSKLLTPGS